jgi:hypothetical protein
LLCVSNWLFVQNKLSQAHRERDSTQLRVSQLEAERDAKAAQEQALGQAADQEIRQMAVASAGGDADMLVGDGMHDGVEDAALNVEQMTIQEIKEWLTDHGYEDEVWALASRKKPRVVRGDWIQLIQEKS